MKELYSKLENRVTNGGKILSLFGGSASGKTTHSVKNFNDCDSISSETDEMRGLLFMENNNLIFQSNQYDRDISKALQYTIKKKIENEKNYRPNLIIDTPNDIYHTMFMNLKDKDGELCYKDIQSNVFFQNDRVILDRGTKRMLKFSLRIPNRPKEYIENNYGTLKRFFNIVNSIKKI